MILVVVGLFQKQDTKGLHNVISSHVCYDAESADDAKRDFLTTDQCLKALNDGYNLVLLHVDQVNTNYVVTYCKEAAQEVLNAMIETIKGIENQEAKP